MSAEPQLFMWSVDFATEIPVVDEQHQNLIEMINTVVKLSLETGTIPPGAISRLRADLGDYVVYHFGTEESMMAELRLDGRHLRAHRSAHEGFTRYIRDFFGRDESPDRQRLRDFSDYLIRWLAYHILNLDKSFAGQIRAIQAGLSPREAYDHEMAAREANTEPLLKALQGLFYIIAEKNRQLELANEELEAKVRARTRELETANQKLSLLAVEDELTRLPNRRYAMATLEQLSREWARYKTPFSVIMIDADRFKAVNDDYGHEYGDKVLRWIASFLTANTRRSDMVTRLGGDEFLVICPRSDVAEAEKLIAALKEKARAVNERESLPYWRVSLSMGTAGPTGRVRSVKTILAKADEAMYGDKARNRG